MALKDLMKSIGNVFSRVSADITRRPDGGTSHYRPLRRKAAEPVPGGAAPQDGGGNTTYLHTGFTGMNPPANYGGYEQQTAYGQTAYGQTAYGQASYGQTAYSQPAYGQGNGGQPEAFSAQQDYVGKGSFSRPTGFSRAQQNNISYMPGVEPKPERGQVHVEHIITLTGMKSCYDAIACMKDGETLIVMLDAIANESESMRCQDMLAGAAFTLGCTVRLLQGGRIVLIAPEGVKILPEQSAMGGMMRPQPMQAPAPAAPAQAPRRERRTGANAAEWSAAMNGERDGYNPYTGTMQVAAGSYGNFGGYGI